MILLYILLHFLTGFGIVANFEAVRKRAEVVGLSLLLGIAAHTVMIFVWEMLHISLTSSSVLGGMLAFSVLANVRFKKTIALGQQMIQAPFDAKLYEIPFIAFGLFIIYISSWRAYYLPVTPYDAIVGMDLVAKYAAKEGHVMSSVFSHPNLSEYIQNQLFYAPFTTFSQIIYNLGGQVIGQTWLGLVFGAFTLWFYGKLRSLVHPVIAGFATLFLVLVPEMYAYTFMFLTDYSSAVFFAVGVTYFYTYYQDKQFSTLVLSALGFGFSIWSRSDTALFIPFGVIVLFFTHYKVEDMKSVLLKSAVWAGIPFVFFALWNIVFFAMLPQSPVNQASEHVGSIMDLLGKYSEMVNTLIIGNEKQLASGEVVNTSRVMYGYAFFLFFPYLIANFAIFRDKKGWEVLIWTLILFIGFGFIAHIFVAATIDNTIKRGFFKLFPVIYLYMCVSSLGQWLSQKIIAWEK